MSELISREEAKLAWAEGIAVQVAIGPDRFRTLVSSDDLGIFDRGNYFRLKPRTITLNNIEIPAPFEPKDGDRYWYLLDCDSGYDYDDYRGQDTCFGFWRTEEEIKQVVSALRSAFKGGV